jgi:hypothetical protein
MIPTFKLNGVVSAAMVLVAAVAIPLWIAHLLGVVELPLTVGSVFVGVLFVLVIVGFILSVFGKRGPAMTSQTTDAKIAATYFRVGKKLRRILIVVAALWLAWLGIQFWRLYGHGG